MKNYRKVFGALALMAAFFAGSLALAADAKKPDGTVTIDSTQFALVLGGSTGGGKLTFQGKTHDFKLGGLTVGINAGLTKIEAAGEVYDLKDLSKFPGTYTQWDASATLGGGAGALYLKNQNGVVMKLASRNKGLQINVGSANGVKVDDGLTADCARLASATPPSGGVVAFGARRMSATRQPSGLR